MAIQQNGILGGFSGKIGNVIGYTSGGRQLFRSVPKKSNKPPTAAQQRQRMAFSLVCEFLLPLKTVINKAHGTSKGLKSNYNKAMSYHIKEAIIGTFPNLAVDYSKVVLTMGALSGAYSSAQLIGSELGFSWVDNTRMGLSRACDLVILVAYNATKNLHAYAIGPATRESQSASLMLPDMGFGDKVHCWIAFISADGKIASHSIYLGDVNGG